MKKNAPFLKSFIFGLITGLTLILSAFVENIIYASAAGVTGTLTWNSSQNYYEITVPQSGSLDKVTVGAIATFLDGHTESLTLEVKGIDWSDSSKWNSLQVGYIEYGEYNKNAKTPGPMKAQVNVWVIGKFNLSITSEDTSKGTVSGPSGSVIAGSSCKVTATAKTGYSFSGWYEGNSLVSKSAEYTFNMPIKDYSIVAKFTPNTYTVTLDPDGGSVSPATKTVTYKATYGDLPSPTKTGHTFLGWYNGTTKITSSTTVTVANNHYLTAKWSINSYTLTISTDNTTMGSVTGDSGKKNYNKYCSVTAVPKSGYSFSGWFVNGAAISYATTYSFHMPANDYSLVAKFSPITYTVTFNAHGGDVSPSSKSVVFNTKYEELPIPTRTGYDFQGWYTEASTSETPKGTKVIATDIHKTPSNITLYAHWTPSKYTITFDKNSGLPTGTSKVVTYTKPYGELPTPQREGFVFAGWTWGTYSINSETKVFHPGDHELTAEWRGNAYKVTLDANEGTLSSNDIYVSYLAPYGPLPTPTRESYRFIGWQLTSGEYVNEYSPVLNPDPHTLTAVWEFKPSSKMVRYDDEYGELPNPTRIGYEFLNWWSQEDASNTVSGNIVDLSTIVKTPNNHKIFAQWKPKTIPISFDSNGGSHCTGVSATYGQLYPQLPVPTKAGYEFTGWYLTELDDNGHGKPIDVGTDIVNIPNNNEGLTLYAGWVIKKSDSIAPITIHFNPRMEVSTLCNDKIVSYNGTYGPLPNPKKTPWIFTGWEYNNTPIFETSTVTVAYEHTLIANWSINVTLDNRYGTPNYGQTVSMVYGETYQNVPVPTKEGYTFGGYYTEVRGQGTRYYDENGKCVWSCDESLTDKATLYAFWIQNPIITPTEPPVPTVTPKPTSAPVRLTIGADTPKVAISANGYNAQKSIPSTEKIQLSTTASEYSFDGVAREVSGTTQMAIRVKIPYVSIWENADTEQVCTRTGEKVITIYVPRDYSYWKVTSATLRKLTGFSINSSLIETGSIAFNYLGELEYTDYVNHDVENEPHVKDPNILLDYRDYSSEPVNAISQTPGTELSETEIIALLTIYAKKIAYNDPTQLKVRSDSLIVDGNILLSDNENSRFGSSPADMSSISPKTIRQFSKTGVRELEAQLNPYTPNGKYSLDRDGEIQCHYSVTQLESDTRTGQWNMKANVTPVFVHTPVVSYPKAVTEDNQKATLSQPDATEEFKTQITIDDYAEFLKLDLSDILVGQHKEEEGYRYDSYDNSKSGKQMFDCLFVDATIPLHIDRNKDSVLPPNQEEWENVGDDLHFNAGEEIRFTRESDLWYVHKEDRKYEIDCENISVYVLAIECTADFEVTYGTLAINGRNSLQKGYDILFASEQSIEHFGQKNANLQPTNYIAYETIPYDVNFRYITLHWYGAEEELAKVVEDNKTIITKQGYEGYFYVTQFDGFEGTVKVRPSFSLVDKNGTLIEEDVLVFYSDKKDGRIYDYLLPSEDDTIKTFRAKWLNVPIIDENLDSVAHSKTETITNSSEISQEWTLHEVNVLESSLAPHIVYGSIMNVRHGAYRLPNNIKVLQRSKIPTSTYFTKNQFLTDYVLRDSVLKSDLDVEYATEGYLKVTLDVSVTFADGTPLIEYGSLPTISMYYTLGEETDGLYFKHNGTPQKGNGIDDDMHVEQIYTN